MIKNNTAMPTHKKKKIKFVDLFAGLGGFHVALQKEGHECIYACELDPRLRSLYSKNFNLKKDYIWDNVTFFYLYTPQNFMRDYDRDIYIEN